MSEIIGFDAKRYPTPGDGGAGMVLLTILVRRTEGTHKAYAAIVPDVSREDPYYSRYKGWVQKNGNPVRYEQARMIWDMEPREYAR